MLADAQRASRAGLKVARLAVHARRADLICQTAAVSTGLIVTRRVTKLDRMRVRLHDGLRIQVVGTNASNQQQLIGENARDERDRSPMASVTQVPRRARIAPGCRQRSNPR
ncbi:hypothetical protein Nwi_2110 [Nitrobacter winogradskyi Nb-255]|jgi:hypothetical protein|uniref:Uncharacterized protein n=1 Tax=Nitrobacter winogradskyi (strain ATCC 25391 / DSM 10237 / CIP 104748 / NCIMB 11846 / Nb-255) TaxID=323098 RepID=Q3SQS6_NITWN|nr:hypothetical protein Nwi_2110 [Nitrobacter winogradskyi Nb-255]